MSKPELYVTLWPTDPHFERFATDYRLAGIRLNSAMMEAGELDAELEPIKSISDPVPYYFDIKGRQIRVRAVSPSKERLELTINHPIKVDTPTMVLFKGGEDYALLERVVDDKHLIFDGGPQYVVKPGESLHIKSPSLEVRGGVLCDYEIDKIARARAAGFERWCLSYVQDQRDIDEFREHVADGEIIAKIESKQGLDYVASRYKKQPNLNLMAACGDLYIEIDRPHYILDALKLIISNEPEALAGSRMLLSLIRKPVPECADLAQLAWLHDIGYRRLLLCDELCLQEKLLAAAINVFESFKHSHAMHSV